MIPINLWVVVNHVVSVPPIHQEADAGDEHEDVRHRARTMTTTKLDGAQVYPHRKGEGDFWTARGPF